MRKPITKLYQCTECGKKSYDWSNLASHSTDHEDGGQIVACDGVGKRGKRTYYREEAGGLGRNRGRVRTGSDLLASILGGKR